MSAQNTSVTGQSTKSIYAYALPRDWDGAPGGLVLKGSDFVLVSTAAQYAQVLELQGQPILITRKFSVTDSRGSMRLLLGGLIEPWRWRRALLNENISRLAVLPGDGAWVFRVAAILARTRLISIRAN